MHFSMPGRDFMGKQRLSDAALRAQIPAARAKADAESGPRAQSARYEKDTARVVVELTNGCMVAFPASIAQGLRGARPEDLAEVQVVLGGRALRWEHLDADLLVSGLVQGLFGTREWMRAMARELGRRGGKVRSEVKAAAARKNGRAGGRPPGK